MRGERAGQGVSQRVDSLWGYPGRALADAYQDGCGVAEVAPNLDGLPETCPWTIEQVLNHAFWP